MNSIYITEKKNIFRHSMYVGGALLILFGLQISIALMLQSTLLAYGYSLTEILEIFTDTWSGYLINSLLLLVICIFPFLLLKVVNNRPVYDICSFNSPKNSLTLPGICFAFGMAMVANIVTQIIYDFLVEYFDFTAIQGSIGDDTYESGLELVYTLVCVAVVPALFEEFAFRGMILGTLRKFGDIPAIIISALFFALYHGNFIQIPFAFIVGIALGIITVITDSIWPAILVHFLNNSYATIMSAIISYTNFTILSGLFLILIIALGIIGLVVLIKKQAFSKFKKPETSLSGVSRFFRMLSAPTTIIFIAIMILEACLSRA